MAKLDVVRAFLGLAAFTLFLLGRGLGVGASGELAIFLFALALLAALFLLTLFDIARAGKQPDRPNKFMLDPDNLPDGVIISNQDGLVLTANTAARQLITSLRPSQSIIDLFDGWHRDLGDRAQADQVVEAVNASPDIQFSEVLNLKDGRVIERNTRPLNDNGNRIWILRDITHVQQASHDSAMHQSMVEADAARTAELAEQLFHAKDELEAKQAELKRLANTDSLTGLLNRRRFTTLGEEAVANAAGEEIWVIMMDIDHFKRINDTYGHAAGDIAIKDFANLATECIGEDGFLGRMGGEEFAAILPGSHQDASIRLAEKIRRLTAKHQTVSDSEKFRFTASIGVAQWMPEEITIEPALDRADQALYSAKAYGRNRVVGFEYAKT